jgi:hypothetical protein
VPVFCQCAPPVAAGVGEAAADEAERVSVDLIMTKREEGKTPSSLDVGCGNLH